VQALLLFLLWLLSAWALMSSHRAAPLPPRGAASAVLAGRIDPNVDPWWKLTALPRIGTQRAMLIVDYRRGPDGPHPFENPADLCRIKGIGPRTVQLAAPLLRFDAPRSAQGGGGE